MQWEKWALGCATWRQFRHFIPKDQLDFTWLLCGGSFTVSPDSGLITPHFWAPRILPQPCGCNRIAVYRSQTAPSAACYFKDLANSLVGCQHPEGRVPTSLGTAAGLSLRLASRHQRRAYLPPRCSSAPLPAPCPLTARRTHNSLGKQQ